MVSDSPPHSAVADDLLRAARADLVDAIEHGGSNADEVLRSLAEDTVQHLPAPAVAVVEDAKADVVAALFANERRSGQDSGDDEGDRLDRAAAVAVGTGWAASEAVVGEVCG